MKGVRHPLQREKRVAPEKQFRRNPHRRSLPLILSAFILILAFGASTSDNSKNGSTTAGAHEHEPREGSHARGNHQSRKASGISRATGADGVPRGSLAWHYDQLAAEADAGDVVSACTLSRSLAFCDSANRRKDDRAATINAMAEVAAHTPAGTRMERRTLKSILQLENESRLASKLCEGLTQNQLSETRSRVMQSARLGDPVAMAYYSSETKPPAGHGIERQRFETQERDNAIRMMERSASLGNIEAFQRLFALYRHGVALNGDRDFSAAMDLTSAVALAYAAKDKLSSEELALYFGDVYNIESLNEITSSPRFAAMLLKYQRYVDRMPTETFRHSEKIFDFSDCGNSGGNR